MKYTYNLEENIIECGECVVKTPSNLEEITKDILIDLISDLELKVFLYYKRVYNKDLGFVE